MKSALYVRVSTDEQVREGTSIDEQKARLQAFAESQGWKEYEFYVDEGFSAKDLDRPAFNRMREDIRSERIGAVITTKIDRLTRRLIDLLQFVDFLDSHQCIYKSSTESFDTGSAAGRMVLQLLGVFAEFERERISERVRDNMHHLAKQGKPFSRPCFGYDLVNRQFMINKEEASWVHKMADWFLNGSGTLHIAKKLNENNVLTKNGGRWSAKAVRNFLENNQMLVGNLVWNKQQRKGKKTIQNPPTEWVIVHNTHPPILEPAIFNEIQTKIERTKCFTPRSKRYHYLLSGLLRCGHCGARMIGSSIRRNQIKHTYSSRYICSNYQKKGLCFNHWIDAHTIEQYVLTNLYKLGQTITTPSPSISTEQEVKAKLHVELRQLKRMLNNLESKAQRQMEAYEADVINLDELKQARLRLQLKKQEWQAYFDQLNLRLNEAKRSDIALSIQEVVKRMENRSEARLHPFQQHIVRELIYEIHIFNSKEIQICYLA
jgi:site-specific DNA recombinase